MTLRKPRPWGTLAIAVLVAAGSAWLQRSGPGVYCDRLAPLSVLAMLAVVILALCFRQLTYATHRAVLAICLLLALLSLATDLRFVLKYHGMCGSFQQQIQRPPGH